MKLDIVDMVHERIGPSQMEVMNDVYVSEMWRVYILLENNIYPAWIFPKLFGYPF